MHASTVLYLMVSATTSRNEELPVISLQSPHVEQSPSQTLSLLASDCEQLGVTAWDRYGDFDNSSSNSNSSSWLRRFERELATELGQDDAVFMPSGGIAQSIALLIHDEGRRRRTEDDHRGVFACHSTSHVLSHEQNGYRALLNMEAVVIPSDPSHDNPSFYHPMSFDRVERTINTHQLQQGSDKVSTLILELPHRELGGKCTSWDDMVRMSDYCRQHNIAFHCDGARLFEASAAYDNKSLSEIAQLFDSIYISFYKGLGGMTGAMLLGTNEFCEQARVWLRRFGGNLYTVLPYAVSGWAGYRRHWCLQRRTNENDTVPLLSFADKKAFLASVVADLQANQAIRGIVTFDPPIPETNMIHGYLKHSVDACNEALLKTQARVGVEVLRRVMVRMGYR